MIPDPEILKQNRTPLPETCAGLDSASLRRFCMEALPVFTSVAAADADVFADSLRQAALEADSDRLLAMMQKAFSEFLYDDFPQLEAHYKDVLFLLLSLLRPDADVSIDIRPGCVEALLSVPSRRLHLVFNLRGSAEDAAGLMHALGAPAEMGLAPIQRVGVSFSAFSRSIDRWIRF